MEHIYILELAGGNYYVGKSADVDKRFEQHKTGTGSAWTRVHRPVRIVETRVITSPHDETNVTKDLMKKYGMDKVRGGAYGAVDLTEEQEDMIRHELRAASDVCYKCGKTGHFANQCKRKSSFTGSCGCGRTFLDFDEHMSHMRMCMKRRLAQAESEEEEVVWGCDYCSREFKTEANAVAHERGCKFKKIAAMAGRQKLVERKSGGSGACYRCGRAGHYSPDCYARTHVHGYPLD